MTSEKESVPYGWPFASKLGAIIGVGVLLFGIALYVGNRTDLFPSFPFLGGITIAIGVAIVAASPARRFVTTSSPADGSGLILRQRNGHISGQDLPIATGSRLAFFSSP